MNWLDIVIGAVVVISFAGALWNGLSREVIRLVALFLGIAGGMWWYDELAAWQPYIENERLAAFAAFAAIVLGSLLVGAMVAWGLGKILHWTGLRWFDRLLGGAFGLVRGLMIATAIVLAVIAFHPTSESTAVVADSRLAPVVFHGAHAAAAIAPARLKLEFSEGFQKVRGIWTETKNAAARKH